MRKLLRINWILLLLINYSPYSESKNRSLEIFRDVQKLQQGCWTGRTLVPCSKLLLVWIGVLQLLGEKLFSVTGPKSWFLQPTGEKLNASDWVISIHFCVYILGSLVTECCNPCNRTPETANDPNIQLFQVVHVCTVLCKLFHTKGKSMLKCPSFSIADKLFNQAVVKVAPCIM